MCKTLPDIPTAAILTMSAASALHNLVAAHFLSSLLFYVVFKGTILLFMPVLGLIFIRIE